MARPKVFIDVIFKTFRKLLQTPTLESLGNAQLSSGTKRTSKTRDHNLPVM